jgi:hypothetical protein
MGLGTIPFSNKRCQPEFSRLASIIIIKSFVGCLIIVVQCLLYLIYFSHLLTNHLLLVYRFKMSVRLVILVLSVLGLAANASAMDRWAALSMIESGDNDRAVGPGGEVSRFQIRPELWPGGNPLDSQAALTAAQEVMLPRLDQFQQSHKRAATDFEFYVLWNAPWQADHPSKIVTERARRFVNLVQR